MSDEAPTAECVLCRRERAKVELRKVVHDVLASGDGGWIRITWWECATKCEEKENHGR